MNDYFGNAVAVGEEFAVAGTESGYGMVRETGSAYIYQKQEGFLSYRKKYFPVMATLEINLEVQSPWKATMC